MFYVNRTSLCHACIFLNQICKYLKLYGFSGSKFCSNRVSQFCKIIHVKSRTSTAENSVLWEIFPHQLSNERQISSIGVMFTTCFDLKLFLLLNTGLKSQLFKDLNHWFIKNRFKKGGHKFCIIIPLLKTILTLMHFQTAKNVMWLAMLNSMAAGISVPFQCAL